MPERLATPSANAIPLTPVTLRELAEEDLQAVAHIDELQTGIDRKEDWRRTFERFTSPEAPTGRIALGASGPDGLEGFLFGEVRAFEFGSEACGWVFAVGVDKSRRRRGTARSLLEEACRRFADVGVKTVRTMVRRDDVPFLSFFRAQTFVGGPFVQLERDLETMP